MSTLAFDTHKAVKALQAAGAAEPLAEAVVATVGEAVGENVATKADIAEVKAEIVEVKAELKAEIAEVKTEIAEVRTDLAEVQAALKVEIAEVKAELKTDLAALESRLHRQLWVMAAGIVGLTVALVKLTA